MMVIECLQNASNGIWLLNKERGGLHPAVREVTDKVGRGGGGGGSSSRNKE